MLLLLLPIASLGIAQERFAEKKEVLSVIAQLRQLAQWHHLQDTDAYLDQQVMRAGPELNAIVKVENESGEPIEAALVVVFESLSDLFNDVYRSNALFMNTKQLHLPLAICTSDDQGVAKLTHVRRSGPGQPHEVQAKNIARASILVVHPRYGLAAVNLAPTDELQELTIAMNKSSIFPGRVTNKTDRPIINRTLLLGAYSDKPIAQSDQRAFYLGASQFAPRANLAEDGSFEWGGLPESGWFYPTLAESRLRIDLPKNGGIELKQQPMDWGVTVSPVDNPEIKVQCLDELNGQPIADCMVAYMVRWQSTDKDGIVAISHYSRVSIASADKANPNGNVVAVNVNPPAGFVPSVYIFEPPQEGKTVELKVPRGAKVTGRVVDDITGKGIGGVDLKLTATNEKIDWQIGTRQVVTATTDAEGRFVAYANRLPSTVEICSLAHGYELPIRKSTGNAAVVTDSFFSLKQEIDLSQAFDREVEFRLKRSKPVHGVVIDKNGKPASKTLVTLEQSTGFEGFRSTTVADEKGAFQLAIVPCGSMKSRLVVKQGESSIAKEIQFNDLGSYEGGPVILDLGQAIEPRSIVGRVVVDGKGKADVSVGIFCDDETDEKLKLGGVYTTRPKLLARGVTNENGDFEVEIKDPEITHCYASVSSPEHLMSWSHQTIPVRDGKTRHPTFEYRTRYGNLKVAGEVLTPDGDVVVGASIRAYPKDRVQLIRLDRDKPNPDADTTSLSDSEGRFACKNLGEGKVELQVHSREGHDNWASAMFQSIVTQAPKSNLIIIIDPKLSVPPEKIQPVSTTKVESLIPKDRFKANGRQYQIEGDVVDAAGSPIAGASAFILAARPLDGPVQINPLVHPVCSLATQTDLKGHYSITIPDDRLQVCVGVFKSGYLPTLTKYLPCDNKELKHKLEKPQTDGVYRTGSWGTNESHPMLVVSNAQATNDSIDNFATDGFDRTDIAGLNGKFIAPSSYSADSNFIVFKPGEVPKLLTHTIGYQPDSANSICSLKGRIVDNKGPVANYRLCCSGSFREHLYETVTNDLGEFQFDGLLFQNSQPTFEYYIYGDATAQDSRGWLKTKIIPNQPDQTISDLGDLKLDSARRVQLTAKNINSQPFTGKGTIRISLRQRGSKPLVIPLTGQSLELKNLPSEPVTFQFELGRNKLFSTDPEFQKIGFTEREFSSIGLPMDADTEMLITIQ